MVAESDGLKLVVLAGPNGAGKSTFFDVYLRSTGLRFVNADLIARALSPENPYSESYRAAAVADIERRALLARKDSFCMETVFSDREGAKLGFLREAQEAGYRVTFIFIGLASAELSQVRVIQRVASGGHDVPDEKLLSRYPRTLSNLTVALSFVDEGRLLDNSDPLAPFQLVARVERGRVTERREPLPKWAEASLPKAGR